MKSLTRAMVFLVVATLLLAGMVTGSYAEEPKVLHMSQNAEMDTLDTGNTGLSATIDMMNLMMDCLFRLMRTTCRSLTYAKAIPYPRMA